MRVYWILIVSFILFSCDDSKDGSKNESKAEAKQDTAYKEIREASYSEGDTIRVKSIEDQDEVKDGPLIVTYPNGVMKAKGILKNGKKNSLWLSYFEDGTMHSSTYFINGVQNGHSITYYRNGKIRYQGEYRDGERVGSWKFFDEEGKLIKEEKF